jgi:myosin heavy subunit
VACVLRLGNIEFNTADTLDQRALIENVPELGRICDMLGLKQSEMKRCLVSRNFGVRSIVTCFFSVQQAKETRDAFSKALYSYLFNWLIKMINRTLATGNKNGTATNQFIALLDIFGFENFETNSYEQLLINYCNEKLQFHFNSHIFVMEQEAYVLQGIDIGYVNFKDNSPTLSAIETKVTGLLAMIDEEINIPKGSDMSLLNKILSTHDKSGCVGRAKPSSKSKTGQRSREHLPKAISIFAIHHYAGDVSYDVNGFLEKNKDALSTDLMYIGKNSTVPFIAELFKDYEASIAKKPDTATTVKKDFSKRSTAQPKGQTIATQFKKQLADLINTLNSTDLYFVRCMKTNNERVGGVFDCELMLRQLQYSGLLEVCRIRQEGYPLRYDFQGFFCMYRKLNPSSTSGPLLVRDLEEKGLFGPEDYCIGKSMIFLKYDAGKKLEQLRGESINDAAIACQSWAKVFLAKRRLQHFLSACRAVQSSAAGQDKSALELIIDIGSRHLPESGSHVPAVAKAKIALKRLVEEEPVINALSIALQRKDFSAMEEAIGQARSLKPEFSHPLVSSCEDAVKAYLKGRMREVKGSFRELAISDRKSSSPPPRNSKASLPLNKSSISSETKKNSFNSKQNVRGNTESLNNQASENVYTAATNSLWGSPSAIRAAKGEISPPRKASATTHSSPVLKMKPKVEKSSPLPLPPPESNGNTVIANGNGDEADEIVGPSEDFKTKKRSILIRRMSAEQIGVAAEVHHMIEVLTNQSMSETGLHPNAIRPLEVLLKKISVRDDSVSREVTEMMMAEQELIRAKKQLLLQTAVDKVRPNTPLWKLKNLSHQARQIGMENYDGKYSISTIFVDHAFFIYCA